ncbi:nucleolin isoform X5 [Rhipicephalus sanguineus]|uniref:nucleolin isoform X5 n=1 Tax=Rhipicephalus sanguineus TaxID=34632 RepID=UPI0020C59837|nr:nucleolin isoform X5 [Rhipicephalus sanguineus]
MAFKKGPAQAQKSGSKSVGQAGKKAPPTKKPLAASLDDDDDDLDEEDDDFSMDEDSDLSGADEDLDDEEVDDEELDDEELDDEELDEESEDEDVPAPKATKQESAATKAQGQQQKSPVKQSPQTPKEKVPVVAAVNGKRKAEFDAGSSPAKKIRLEDHIPAFFVVDYEERDLRDVKLTSFPDGVTKDDLEKLCKGGHVVRQIHQNKKLVCAFVNYANKEEAVAAVHSLRGANLKGAAIKASYCGGRWNSPARPQLQPDTLDIRRVPKAYQNKNKLAALFPTGEVLKVQKDGYAQVKFPSSEALIKAVKNPKCRTIDNRNLTFAIALVPKWKHNKPAVETSQNAAVSPKNRKAGSLETEAGKSTAKGQTSSKQPGGPIQKGSPQTPAQKKQRRKKSKSPGQQGGPMTPGQQGGPKTPGQKGGPKTPGGSKTPGQQGGPKTPGQQAGPKTPGQQAGPKTPGQQAGPKTPGQKGGPKTPGQKGPKTPGQAKGGAKTPKGTPFQKTPGMKGTPVIA